MTPNPKNPPSLKPGMIVTMPEQPLFQVDREGHALISAESKRQIFQAIIGAVKKAIRHTVTHYGSTDVSHSYFDHNLFIQELEKLLIEN